MKIYGYTFSSCISIIFIIRLTKKFCKCVIHLVELISCHWVQYSQNSINIGDSKRISTKFQWPLKLLFTLYSNLKLYTFSLVPDFTSEFLTRLFSNFSSVNVSYTLDLTYFFKQHCRILTFTVYVYTVIFIPTVQLDS